MLHASFSVLWLVLASAQVAAQTSPSKQRVQIPTVREPTLNQVVDQLASLLDRTRVLAIGERHGWEEQRRFLIDVLRSERIASRIDDIVIECGNSRFQRLADDYVSGADVPSSALSRIWRSTAAITLTPPSICGDVFDIAREWNARAGKTRALRVLLGQPPIDWFGVTATSKLDSFPLPDVFLAGLIEHEVIDKGRKAIVIVGSGHLFRDPRAARQTLVQRIDAASAARVIALVPYDGFGNTPGVDSLEAQLAKLSAPALLLLGSSHLGAIDASALFSNRAQKLVNGVVVEVEVPHHPGIPLRALFDGLLYLGNRASMTPSRPTDQELADTAFIRELDRRSRLQFGRPYTP